MRRKRKVKIVATLGPSSDDARTIQKLFEAGVDVFRLNMSHGAHEDVRRRHAHIRRISAAKGRPIGILADLQGPKIRCSTFLNGSAMLREGKQFRFDLDRSPGTEERVCLPHPEVFEALRPDATLLVDDGKVRLQVIDCGEDFANCEVISSGRVSDRKGVNLPDVVLPLAALSDKDKQDLEFVCELGVDWVAMSFVQRPEDIAEGKALVRGRASVMAKVEKPAAIDCIDSIIDEADGIMVARGDLGVEMQVNEIPPIQRRLVRRCRAAAKPVVVATQMLESMIGSPVPTRAEVSDVATAIYEGADAVMLSAESAAGRYPIQSVETMNNVAISVESDELFRRAMETTRRVDGTTVADAITSAAREIAETTEVAAICCFTHSGQTAVLVARERTRVPQLVLTPFEHIAQRLCLLWGAHCVMTPRVHGFEEAVEIAAEVASVEKLGSDGDKVIILAGVPFNVAGSTNIIRVGVLGDS